MSYNWPTDSPVGGSPFFIEAAVRDMKRHPCLIGPTAWRVPIKYLLIHSYGRYWIVANKPDNLASAFAVSCSALLSFDADEMLAAFTAYDLLHYST